VKEIIEKLQEESASENSKRDVIMNQWYFGLMYISVKLRKWLLSLSGQEMFK